MFKKFNKMYIRDLEKQKNNCVLHNIYYTIQSIILIKEHTCTYIWYKFYKIKLLTTLIL